MKIILVVLALFCFLHIYRSYLQIKGRKSWFTQFGHVWDKPQYEKQGMIVFFLLGCLSIFLAVKA